MASKSTAMVFCSTSLQEAQSIEQGLKESCENNLDGGGGVFNKAIIVEVSSCTDYNGVIHDNGVFWRSNVGCETCQSVDLAEERNQNKALCNSQCKKEGLQCLFQTWEWGSVNSLLGASECGSIDNSLPNCALSSSSISNSSSSEEEMSSSSSGDGTGEESSSSGSSDGGDGGETGGLHCINTHTSQGVLCLEHCPVGGYKCWVRSVSDEDTTYSSACRFLKKPITSLRPEDISVGNERTFGCMLQLTLQMPVVAVQTFKHPTCFTDSLGSSSLLWHDYFCNTPNGFTRPTELSGTYLCDEPSGSIQYSVQFISDSLFYSRGEINDYYHSCYTHTYYDGENISCQDVDNIDQVFLAAVFEAYVQRNYGVSIKEYYASKMEANNCGLRLSSSTDSFINSSSSSASISSGNNEFVYSSSSSSSYELFYSNTAESSSSSSFVLCENHPFVSVPQNTLSTCFNANGTCYKCNSERSSSECGGEWLWMGDFIPANVGWWYTKVDCTTGIEKTTEEETIGVCPLHPLKKVPSDPQNACFASGGTCYKCNSERSSSECGGEWLWMRDFIPANVGWWYTEVDCTTGIEKTTEEETIGVCPLHPLKKVPSDPQNACFASGGVCYKCNSDRGSACANDWLWIYSFNSSNVGHWYEQVDCFNPNGEDHDGQCPDGSVLQKSVAKSSDDSKEAYVDYTNELLNTQKYYDVLGRKANRNSKQKQALYRLDKMNSQNSKLTEDTELSDKIRRLLNKVFSSKKVLQKAETCGTLGGDYGIVELDGSLVGGITCPFLSVKPIDIKESSSTKKGVCNDGSAIIDVFVEITFRSFLTSNDYFVVPVNYVFPENGHRTTEEDVRKLKKHELGHVAYNKCIEAKFSNEVVVESKQFCECGTSLEKSFEKWRDQLYENKYSHDRTRFEKARDLFHEKYGQFDGADTYVCPSNL